MSDHQEEILVDAETLEVFKRLLLEYNEKLADGKMRVQLKDADNRFKLRWNVVAKLFKKPEEIQAFVEMMAELYESDVKEHGRFEARMLYRKRVLLSVWPIISWLLHTIRSIRRRIG